MGGGVSLPATEERAHAGQQLADPKRFGEIVVRAEIERFDLGRFLSARGEHDHRNIRPPAQLAQQGQSVEIGQHQIEDEQIGRIAPEPNQRRRAPFRELHLVAMAPQGDIERAPDLRFVIDDQNARIAHAGASARREERSKGIVKRTDVPIPSGPLSIQMRPPCASTSPRLIVSPIPVPCNPRALPAR